MNIDELLLDESVHTRVMKRREKELKAKGTKKDVVDSEKDVIANSNKSVDSFGKNKHIQRAKQRAVKAFGRLNRKNKTSDASDDGGIIPGQAAPSKDHIQHYTVTKELDKTKGSDHEKGHTKQDARIYARGGTKGIAKRLEIESKTSSPGLAYAMKAKTQKEYLHRLATSKYGTSPMEHNANHYAQEGDSKRVKKEREDIAKAYTKGRNAVEKLRNKNIKQSGLSKDEYGKKNLADQVKLSSTEKDNKTKHESVFIGVTLK